MGKKLDAYNEILAERGLNLHPTKGFRKLSVKRARAGWLVTAMKNGQRGLDTVQIRMILAHG